MVASVVEGFEIPIYDISEWVSFGDAMLVRMNVRSTAGAGCSQLEALAGRHTGIVFPKLRLCLKRTTLVPFHWCETQEDLGALA